MAPATEHSELVNTRWLQRVSLTNHAVARFAERADLPIGLRSQRAARRVIRDLLLCEGRVLTRPPKWGRSQGTADLYTQAGEWILFICRANPRHTGRYDAVTVVNGPVEHTWRTAHSKSYIFSPPPLQPSLP